MARKEKSIHYIYKTTCDLTFKYYIGMHSTNCEDDGYIGSGKRLRHSIRKYGIDNHSFEILEYCTSREMLILKEIEIISSDILNDPFCMNLMSGGTGGFVSLSACTKGGEIASKIHTDKLKNDLLYKQNFNLQMKIGNAEYHKSGRCKYDTFKGKLHSEKTKQLISEKRKGTGLGEKNSQFGTCWITKDGLNKKIKKEDINTFFEKGWITGRK